MRIAYVVPGSGGGFYCENCLRDGTFADSLRRAGFAVWSVPLYLPLFAGGGPGNAPGAGAPEDGAPLFYGAIALYLRQRFRLFRNLPGSWDRWLNARPLLALAARAGGSTRAAGLEEMTISMLSGEAGGQAAELGRLMAWLERTVRPDIVHLSNALLLGLAPAVKRRLGARVICSLQDEHVWIDPMGEPARRRSWDLLRENARFVDRFIAVSGYYRDFIAPRLGIDPTAVSVVPPGADTARYVCRERPPVRPVIGFLSRLEEASGLDALVEALGLLVTEPGLSETRLLAYGGRTGDDAPFVRRVRRTVRRLGLERRVELSAVYDRARRFEFLSRLSVLCVPRCEPEAFGMFLLEAFCSGVPAVAPRLGGFTELVEAVDGGLLYPPGDVRALAAALRALLLDRPLAARLGANGCARSRELYSVERSAALAGAVYRETAGTAGVPGKNLLP